MTNQIVPYYTESEIRLVPQTAGASTCGATPPARLSACYVCARCDVRTCVMPTPNIHMLDTH